MFGIRRTRHNSGRLVVIGFDGIGQPSGTAASLGEGNLDIVFGSTDSADFLDDAVGAIVLQGAFESIRERRDLVDAPYTDVRYDKDGLLARERQAHNLIAKNGWICFLVRNIIDYGYSDHGVKDLRGTDLCKRILNSLDVRRGSFSRPIQCPAPVAKEFGDYIKCYGTANTYFGLPTDKDGFSGLVSIQTSVVGFEWASRVFVLPFHPRSKEKSESLRVVATVSEAIEAYRSRVILPSWTEEIRFASESRICDERSRLMERVAELDREESRWKTYRRVLVDKGEDLRRIVADLLEAVLGVTVDRTDSGREDLVIKEGGEIVALVEIKGATRGGIGRDAIAQCIDHRVRSGRSLGVPVLYIVNNDSNVAGVAARLKTPVASEQVVRAAASNVLIVRTIDLLMLTLTLEERVDRSQVFLGLARGGGGWLRCGPDGYELLTK